MRHRTRSRRRAVEGLKKAAVWIFIGIFVVSIVGGVVLIAIGTR